MRDFLLIGLGLLGLTACRPVQPPSFVASSRLVLLSPAVLARCETVSWSDASFVWSGNQLTSHSRWAAGQLQSVSAPNQNIVLDGNEYSLVSKVNQAASLDSTFTCTKTGEVLKAAYTFPNAVASAKILLDVQNGGLVGQWEAYLPPA